MDVRKLRILGLIAFLAVLLASCATTPPPAGGGPDPDPPIDLQGLWSVTPAPGTAYGAGGTTTVEFGAQASGTATFLSQSDENGITTCERHVYASLTENVIMLDDVFYVADQVDDDQIVLNNDTDTITLNRLTGAPPVAPCPEATATEVQTFDFGTGSFTGLNAVGTRLYFNTNDADSIIGFNTATNALGAPRTYTQSVSGGTHRWVIGARSDDLFYGHCGCGGSTSVNYFNLSSNTSIANVDSVSDLGVGVGFRFGYFDGSNLHAGGRSRDDVGVNLLLTLNPDTLALVSQRQILRGAFIQDLTLHGTDLLALVGGSLVVVGTDGRASETIDLNGSATQFPRGVASIGDNVYVLDQTATGNAVLYEVTMP